MKKDSNYSFGLSIPATKYVDINIYKHRGTDLGFGISYKANYSKNIIQKNEFIQDLEFTENDKHLLSSNDDVFSGTINVILAKYEIYTQSIYLESNNLHLTVDQNKYRNLNDATFTFPV